MNKKNGWLLFFLFLLVQGCVGTDKSTKKAEAETEWIRFENEIHRIVSDKDRAGQLVEFASQTRLMAHEIDLHMEAYRKKVHDLNADYDTTPEDFQKAFAAQKKWKHDFQNRLLIISQKKRSLTTEDEWRQLTKVRVRFLEKSLETIPGFE